MYIANVLPRVGLGLNSPAPFQGQPAETRRCQDDIHTYIAAGGRAASMHGASESSRLDSTTPSKQCSVRQRALSATPVGLRCAWLEAGLPMHPDLVLSQRHGARARV